MRLYIRGQDEPIDLWVPLNITVRELWAALNAAYHLTSDAYNAFLQAENPIMFLGADHAVRLSDVGFRNGTRLYFTNREPVR